MATDYTPDYLEPAFAPDRILLRAARELRGVDFDTMVGTGLSGTLVVPILARAMGKKFLIVRKGDDVHNHSPYRRVVGTLGAKWLFVDDFVATGKTLRHVKDTIRAL